MSMLFTSLLVIQVISALSIIVLVLLQQGKGADMGSAFGSGSAGSLFGATGAANFLSRTTKWCAVVFFATTAGLAYLGHNPGGARSPEGGVMESYDRSVPQAPGAPAVPGGGDASVPAVPDAGVPQAPAQPESGAAPAQPDAAAQPQPAPAPEVPAPAAQQPPAQDGAQAPAGQAGEAEGKQ